MTYKELPQPHELSMREKEDAMGSYLMMFAAVAAGLPLPIVNLIAAVVYYYVSYKKSRFVHFHAHQSLFSQLPTTLVNWAGLYWTLQIFLFDNYILSDYYYAFLVFLVVVNIIYFIFSIVGAVRARSGRFIYFLFFGGLAYNKAFRLDNGIQYANEKPLVGPNKPLSVNTPPY